MREEKILINNFRVNYKIGGEGEDFLILHGWGSSAERWQKIGESLVKNGYKVVIVDLPGFGETDKPLEAWSLDDYCNFIDNFTKALKLERFYLLGHSFGGSLAIKYSLRFPEKIKKMFLVASAGIRRKTFKKSFFRKIAKVFKKLSFLPFYSLIRRAFYKVAIRKSDYPYTEGVMKKTFLKVINEDLSGVVSKISVPTIIIWGDKDELVPLADAYFLNQEIKNSKLEIISEGTHNLAREKPEELIQKIIDNL